MRNKNILIIGIARSGIGAAKLAYGLGAKVSLYDGKDKEGFNNIIEEYKEFPFEFYFGEFEARYLEGLDTMILSPGVPVDLWFVEEARKRKIEVIGEIELAYRVCKAPIIAITGTNGKTTTTSLVGEIISLYNKGTKVVGNIGKPFTNIAAEIEESDVVVAEISSFQLETIQSFAPKISAILNITEDHLNRHKTMENYIDSKTRIAENQSENNYCILNYDDAECIKIAKKIKAEPIWFSTQVKVEGAYIDNNVLYFSRNNSAEKIISADEITLLGKHNLENILAAIAITRMWEVPAEIIRKGISQFKGVEHRIEFSGTVKGVNYYNDSKATNPDAAIKGVLAMVSPTILIAGGMDKGSSYTEWINSFRGIIKEMILFGETKYNIEKAARECGFNSVFIVNNLEEAVFMAKDHAQTGDSVLLSPACASWDMFTSFEERGDLFKDLVTNLES